MPVKEASSEETPYGRYITSDGWFVLNLSDSLAVRNEEKGGGMYPLEGRRRSETSAPASASSGRATRTLSTTRRTRRKGSSSSRVSAR